MPRGAAGSQSSPFFTAFTPRQVLLLNHPLQRNTSVSAAMAKDRSEQMVSSKIEDQKVEDDSVLTYSVALWLSKKGFSKVLKRLLSSANIQDDTWKDKALDLNDIYCKYQEAVSAAYEGLKIPKKLDANGDAASLAAGEVVHKKNKKKKGGSNGDIDVTEDNEDLKTHENQVREDGNLKKRKKKTDCDAASIAPGAFPDQAVNGNKSEVSENEKQDQHWNQSTKKKDKNKKKSAQQSLDADDKKPDESVNAQKSKESGVAAVESKKVSMKRKRKALDEPENNTSNEVAAEEVKPKKLKKTENVQTDVPETEENGHLDGQDKPQNALPIQSSSKSVSAGHANENAKDSLVHGTDKSIGSKFSKKKACDISEPKTVKAFQRVKIDELTFVDDRLQDNSYWAKGGAENGYGAKAEEVLGQVKGRDFRHEKTKKKRGSYRGGQIDLQSHSIKFNYSDDE